MLHTDVQNHLHQHKF